MFLAFMGISEGAIPFALESPITAIPSYMVGAIVGSTAAVWLGPCSGSRNPLSGRGSW